MTITAISRDTLTQTISIVRMIAANTAAQITTAGYISNSVQRDALAAVNSGGWEWLTNDVVLVSASDATFLATIDPAFTTLTPISGTVVLPVVNNDFANFSGTAGDLKDSGYSPSDPTKNTVSMVSGTINVNHVAKFADTAGTIEDGGLFGTAASKAASDNSQPSVASVNGATVAGNFLVAADINGTVKDAGYVINFGVSSIYGGGGTSNSFLVTGMNTDSLLIVTANNMTNIVPYIAFQILGGFTVIFESDPGANTFFHFMWIPNGRLI